MTNEWVDFSDKEADVVKGRIGTFLAVQWLRLHPSNAGGSGSIPGWEIRFRMPRNAAKKTISK